jgi:hypothetical protein
MRNLFISSILALTFCAATFAQTNKTSLCPTISVTGPAGIFEPGETITFIVSLNREADKINLKYNWTVSGGEITEGQRTQAVKVLVPKTSTEISIMAMVEVQNLPRECGTTITASETVAMIICRVQRQVDEFSMSVSQIDKARLDNLLHELQNDPVAIAYIFERFERKTSQKLIKRKIQKISDYLIKEKRIEKDRFVISITESNKNLTQYFIVPPGASTPKIEDYN